jgi:predicted transcriptional regulator
MSGSILEVIFLSENRTDILLFLKNGSKTITEIKEFLNLSSMTVLPHLKKLRDNFMILKRGNTYSLSPLGIAIVSRMQPMVDLLNIFGTHYDYWTNHTIECIPIPLLERIGELSNCTLSEPPDRTRFFELQKDWLENFERSKKLSGICSVFSPDFISAFRLPLNKGIKVSILVTSQVFERLRKDFEYNLKEFFTFEDTSLYVCNENLEFTHIVTDKFLSLTLPLSNGTYDQKQHIFCFDPVAIQWGEDLFAHYRDLSEKITGIEF